MAADGGPAFATAVAMVPSPTAPRPRILLFSDVDGTLLHDTETEGTRIDRLAVLQGLARVVLVSSRTVPDLHRLRRRWGFTGDFIAENGAFTVVFDEAVTRHHQGGRWTPHHGAKDSSWYLHEAGAPVNEIAAAIERALVGSAAADLFQQGIHSAGQRHRGGSVRLAAAIARTAEGIAGVERLRAVGLHASVGGRWLVVWRGPDKGAAMTQYVAAIEEWLGQRFRVGAAGNADNDQPMLEAADHRWVFPDPAGHHAASLASIPGAELLGTRPAEAWANIIQFLEQSQEG
jgi:predicted mannosyl-3-phosphoglycerate phosphatase (HAD superfamily)